MKLKITLVLLLIISSASAQTTLNGRIIDKVEKQPISYASVTIKSNPAKGSSSNDEGWFSLQCNQNDTLFVQCIGYKTKIQSAVDVFLRPTFELVEDTISLKEVSVTAESAYNMLFRVRDNTVKQHMKLFHGICLRKDELSLNGNTERVSDAEIIFKSRKTKNEEIEIDYWLKKHTLELFSKSPKQPRLSYPNTIPFILSLIKTLSPKEVSNVNCSMKSISDSVMVINVKMNKPTKNMINDCYYFINKNKWLFDGFEFIGDFKNEPLKKDGRHYFKTNINLSYNSIKDSIILARFDYDLVFSNKKVDEQNLWNYKVNMEVFPTENTEQSAEGKKLHKIDYLLYND